MDGEAVETVRDCRARRATASVLGPEHEVIEEKLRASSEEIGQGRRALIGLELVLLVDSNPRQLLPPLRQLVAAPREFLLGRKQVQACREPLFTGSDLVVSHVLFPLPYFFCKIPLHIHLCFQYSCSIVKKR